MDLITYGTPLHILLTQTRLVWNPFRKIRPIFSHKVLLSRIVHNFFPLNRMTLAVNSFKTVDRVANSVSDLGPYSASYMVSHSSYLMQYKCKFMSNSIKFATNLQQTCIAFQKKSHHALVYSFEMRCKLIRLLSNDVNKLA